MAPSLTDAQLRAELQRCQSCEARPCRGGCPVRLSPTDFILAARGGAPSDFRRAAAQILGNNPLGGVCGAVCPDTLCMARCARRGLDGAVDIPAIQGAIVRRARELGLLPRPAPPPPTGQRVAVVGAGPAGLGAASVLARAGHTVHLFDRARAPGGMLRLVPRERLDPAVLEGDLAGLLGEGDVRLALGRPVALPRDLLAKGFAAVIVAAGLGEPAALDVPGHERAFDWTRLLGARPPALRGKRVAIVGDGSVALDCAEAAIARGAAHVELFARKTLTELGLTRRERDRLFASGVHVTCRVRVTALLGRGVRVTGLALRKLELPAGQSFHPSRLLDLGTGDGERRDFDAVVLAMGGQPGLRREPHPRVVYAGDLETGPTTVVEALASGRRAGLAVHALLGGSDAACPDRATCPEGGGACPKRATCPEWTRAANPDGGASAPRGAGLPVALDCDFQGRRLRSPFLLAPSPFTAGYAQVRRAFEAGWAGAVIGPGPGEAGADGAPDRIRADAERLRHEFPDRLTLTSPDGLPAGDPADYRAAAALLARGAPVVQVDALVRRHGLGILGELQAGLAHHLAERGLRSVSELVGRDARAPSTPADLPASGLRCEVERDLCSACGNCARCPYEAIALDAAGIPAVDPARCTGCALCAAQCFTGAIRMAPLPPPEPR